MAERPVVLQHPCGATVYKRKKRAPLLPRQPGQHRGAPATPALHGQQPLLLPVCLVPPFSFLQNLRACQPLRGSLLVRTFTSGIPSFAPNSPQVSPVKPQNAQTPACHASTAAQVPARLPAKPAAAAAATAALNPLTPRVLRPCLRFPLQSAPCLPQQNGCSPS